MDPDPPSRGSQGGRRNTSVESAPSVQPRVFYGWWIVAAATAASTIQSAVFNVGAQALVLPLQREFNTTRTAIAFAFSLRRLEGGVTGPLEGYLIHWIGPRRYMMWGWVVFGAGLICVGLSQNLYQFYASFLLVTLGPERSRIPAYSHRLDQLVQFLARESHRHLPVGREPWRFATPIICLVDSQYRVARNYDCCRNRLNSHRRSLSGRNESPARGLRIPAGRKAARKPGGFRDGQCESSRGRPHRRPVPARSQLLVPGPVPLRRDNRLGRAPGPSDTGAG